MTSKKSKENEFFSLIRIKNLSYLFQLRVFLCDNKNSKKNGWNRVYGGAILAPSCVIVLSSYVSKTWAKCSLSRGFLNWRFLLETFFRFGISGFFCPWSCIERMPVERLIKSKSLKWIWFCRECDYLYLLSPNILRSWHHQEHRQQSNGTISWTHRQPWTAQKRF